MKRIQIVKGNNAQKIFAINDYSFIEVDSRLPSIPIYRIIIKQHFESQLDVRYWLEDIIDQIQYLSDTPSELTDYIKRHEENIRFKDNYLFHDLRTRYIDFLCYGGAEEGNNVMLLGYTPLSEETCFAVKAFSLKELAEFVTKLLNYCRKNEIATESENNLRWMQLEQCLLPNSNIGRNDIFDKFMECTLQKEYCDIFLRAFKFIDSQGYVDRSFFNERVLIHGKSTSISKLNKVMKFFSPFWKSEIGIKGASRTVLCLHDELPNNESIDNMVYTIKPHLMQYYQLHWFEDFCSEVINHMDIGGFRIRNHYSGRRFDFFQNDDDKGIREIDIVLEVEYNGDYKIVAVECKKTLTNDEIKSTNRKIKDKILKSQNNMIDAYIHIGCFQDGIDFDKVIKETRNAYKQGKIQSEDGTVYDAPYFAFSGSSIKDLETKVSYVLKEIFEQW